MIPRSIESRNIFKCTRNRWIFNHFSTRKLAWKAAILHVDFFFEQNNSSLRFILLLYYSIYFKIYIFDSFYYLFFRKQIMYSFFRNIIITNIHAIRCSTNLYTHNKRIKSKESSTASTTLKTCSNFSSPQFPVYIWAATSVSAILRIVW